MRIALWSFGILGLLLAGLVANIYLAGRPAQAAPAQYVALGSSFAATVTVASADPAGPMIVDRAPDSPWFCFRSRQNYAHQLARLRGLRLVDVSCGGAVTRHVLQGGQALQPAQLDALRPQTELVTLTIGGNDINYVGTMMMYGCRLRTHGFFKLLETLRGCNTWPPRQIEARLQALPAQLDRIATEVRQRSPRARLVMLTYQTVLPPAGTCDRLGLNPAQADQMREVAAALAAQIRAAATRNAATLFDAAAATAGHDVCAADPWIADQVAPVPLHTTVPGMAAIAQGLDQALGPAVGGGVGAAR